MTINAQQAAQQPLNTDNDKVARVRDLLAPASNPAQLWVLILDRDSYQSPLVVPIDERPAIPDPAVIDSLLTALGAVAREQLGKGCQAMFVLERLGSFGITAKDHCWAAALQGACDRAAIPCAGTFLLSPGGVSPVAP
ncbi:MAG: hypothetical protein ABI382_11770 [Nakamurella sp.]